MANLPENQQYQGTNTPTSFGNLSSVLKGLQEKTNKEAVGTFENPFMQQYNPDVAASMFDVPNKVEPSATTHFPVGQPLAPQAPDTKYEPIPDYVKYVQPDKNNNWVLPSDQAMIRNMPISAGGGQYTVDTTQPGAWIKSERVLANEKFNPGVRKAILGNLPSALFQIDHTIPLWAGGADTLANLQVLANPEHAKKTAVQAVPLTLLANGLITKEQARVMALSWKDKDPSGIPAPDSNGYIDKNKALKIAKNWEKGPSMWKFFGKSFNEEMQDFGKGWLPTPIREFGKGLVGGGTAGIVPGTQASPESGKVGSVSNFIGNLAGMITGIGALGKLSAGAGLFGKAAKASTLPLLRFEGVTKGARAATEAMRAEKMLAYTNEALKSIGAVTDVGNLAKVGKWAGTGKKMAQNALLLSMWGQLGLTGREMTQQEEFEFKNHLKQAAVDTVFGGLLGATGRFGKEGQSLAGYAWVGGATTAFTLMTQDEPDIVEAVKQGIIMTALHAMGYRRGIIDPKIRMASDEATKMSMSTMNTWLGDVVPTVRKGQPVPEKLSLDLKKVDAMRNQYQSKYPKDQRFVDVRPITTDAEAVEFLSRAAQKEMGNWIARNVKKAPDGVNILTPELISKIKAERTRIITASNQLYNRTLDPQVRPQKEWQDRASLGEKLRPQITSEDLRPAQNTTELVNRLNTVTYETLNGVFENKSGKQFTEGVSAITGNEKNPEARATIAEMKKNPDAYVNKYVVIKDPEASVIMRFVNAELAAQGKGPAILDPEQTLQVYALKKTPNGLEPRYIGNMPEKRSFNDKTYALNKPYEEATLRLKNEVAISSSPEELMKVMKNDPAKPNMTIEQATALFARKGEVKTMPDEEFYSYLNAQNALQKYNAETMNTNSIAEEMDKNGIQVLFVDRGKIYGTEAGKEFTFSEARLNEQNWLRSLNFKKPRENTPVSEVRELKIPQEPSPVSTAIRQVTTKAAPTMDVKQIEQELRSTPDLSSQVARTARAPKENVNRVVEDMYRQIIDRVEYAKADTSSAQAHRKSLMAIVDGFKAKNPGLSDADFKYAISSAKGRAGDFVQDIINTQYEGTEIFGDAAGRRFKKKFGSEIGDREIPIEDEAGFIMGSKAAEKTQERHIQTESERLAQTFGLEMTEPDKFDRRFIKLVKGEPVFSSEFKKQNDVGNQSPLDFWGTFLDGEMRAYKSALTKNSKEWQTGLKEMMKSKSEYDSAFAKTVDEGLRQKYGGKYGDYGNSWTLSSVLRERGARGLQQDMFTLTGDSGLPISQPYRNIWAITRSQGDPAARRELLKKANIKTAEISEAAARDRELRTFDSSADKEAAELGLGQRDPNQIRDVVKDITPFELIQNGRISAEIRNDLVDRYNTAIDDLGRADLSEARPLLRNDIKNLFHQIKEMSINTPEEVKEWKIGEKIVLKNGGEPTKAEGVNDGLRFLSTIFARKKMPGFVDYEKIKQSVLGKKDGEGGPYDGQGGIISDMWGGVKDAVKGIGTTTYRAVDAIPKTIPQKTYDVRGLKINDKDIEEAARIIGLEISNRPQDRQEFETRHIVNTAINRALTGPDQWGRTLTEVLQKDKQYQAYAPKGMVDKEGNVVKSRYQKLLEGATDDAPKVELVKKILEEMKSGKFEDTTEGSVFYVHASDGTLWLGKTQEEAIGAMKRHEQQLKLQRTQIGSTMGLPV